MITIGLKNKIREFLCHHEWEYITKPSNISMLRCAKCNKVEQYKKNKKYNISRRTYCWCPDCNNDLVRDSFISEDVDSKVVYKCSWCGCTSDWDFSLRAMIPSLITKNKGEVEYNANNKKR